MRAWTVIALVSVALMASCGGDRAVFGGGDGGVDAGSAPDAGADAGSPHDGGADAGEPCDDACGSDEYCCAMKHACYPVSCPTCCLSDWGMADAGMDAGADGGPADGGAFDAGTNDGGIGSYPTAVAGSGSCLTDSECPQGSYCDFTATFSGVGFDAGRPFACGMAVVGSCLTPCGTIGSPCQIPEDCPVEAWCEQLTAPTDGGTQCSGLCDVACSDEAPCSSGECVASFITACPAAFCPDGCSFERMPHPQVDCPACICATCSASPDGG